MNVIERAKQSLKDNPMNPCADLIRDLLAELKEAHDEGYATAVNFIANAYQSLGDINTAAEIRSMHTPATCIELQSKKKMAKRILKLEAELAEALKVTESFREEMKSIALAIGRSKTDGESDCDWFYLAGDIISGKAEVCKATAMDCAEIADSAIRIYEFNGINSEYNDACREITAAIKQKYNL